MVKLGDVARREGRARERRQVVTSLALRRDADDRRDDVQGTWEAERRKVVGVVSCDPNDEASMGTDDDHARTTASRRDGERRGRHRV